MNVVCPICRNVCSLDAWKQSNGIDWKCSDANHKGDSLLGKDDPLHGCHDCAWGICETCWKLKLASLPEVFEKSNVPNFRPFVNSIKADPIREVPLLASSSSSSALETRADDQPAKVHLKKKRSSSLSSLTYQTCDAILEILAELDITKPEPVLLTVLNLLQEQLETIEKKSIPPKTCTEIANQLGNFIFEWIDQSLLTANTTSELLTALFQLIVSVPPITVQTLSMLFSERLQNDHDKVNQYRSVFGRHHFCEVYTSLLLEYRNQIISSKVETVAKDGEAYEIKNESSVSVLDLHKTNALEEFEVLYTVFLVIRGLTETNSPSAHHNRILFADAGLLRLLTHFYQYCESKVFVSKDDQYPSSTTETILFPAFEQLLKLFKNFSLEEVILRTYHDSLSIITETSNEPSSKTNGESNSQPSNSPSGLSSDTPTSVPATEPNSHIWVKEKSFYSDFLLPTYQKFLTCSSVIEILSSILWNISTFEFLQTELLLNPLTFELLVNAFSRYSGIPFKSDSSPPSENYLIQFRSTIREIAGAINNFSVNDIGKIQFSNLEFCEIISTALSSLLSSFAVTGKEDWELFLIFCAIITNLAVNQYNKRLFGKNKQIFESLTRTLDKAYLIAENREEGVIQYTLFAIKNLSLTIANQQYFADLKIMPILIKLLKQYRQNEDTVILICEVIHHLSSSIEEEEGGSRAEDPNESKEQRERRLTVATELKKLDANKNLLIHHHKYQSVLHHSFYYHFHQLPKLCSHSHTTFGDVSDDDDDEKEGRESATATVLTSYYLPILTENDSILFQQQFTHAKANLHLQELLRLQGHEINNLCVLFTQLLSFHMNTPRTILAILKATEHLLLFPSFQEQFHGTTESLTILVRIFCRYSETPSQSALTEALLCQMNLILKRLCYYKPNIEALSDEKVDFDSKGNEDTFTSLETSQRSSNYSFCEMMMHSLIRQIHREEIISSQLMVLHQFAYISKNLVALFTPENCQILVTVATVHSMKDTILHEIIAMMILACQPVNFYRHLAGNLTTTQDYAAFLSMNRYAEQCKNELGYAGMCEILCEALQSYQSPNTANHPAFTSNPFTVLISSESSLVNETTVKLPPIPPPFTDPAPVTHKYKSNVRVPLHQLKMIQDICYIISILTQDHPYNQLKFAKTNLCEILLQIYNNYLLNLEIISSICLTIHSLLPFPILKEQLIALNIHSLLVSTMVSHLSNMDVCMIVCDCILLLLSPSSPSPSSSPLLRRVSSLVTATTTIVDEELFLNFSHTNICTLLMSIWNMYMLNYDFILHLCPLVLLFGQPKANSTSIPVSLSARASAMEAFNTISKEEANSHKKVGIPPFSPTDSTPQASTLPHHSRHDLTLLIEHQSEENIRVFSISGGCELCMQTLLKYKKKPEMILMICPMIRMLLLRNQDNYLRFYEMNLCDVLTELFQIYQLKTEQVIEEIGATILTTIQPPTSTSATSSSSSQLGPSPYQMSYIQQYGNKGLCEILSVLVLKQCAAQNASLPVATTTPNAADTANTPATERPHVGGSHQGGGGASGAVVIEIIHKLNHSEENKIRFQQSGVMEAIASMNQQTNTCIVC